jgi:hypothetical protein
VGNLDITYIPMAKGFMYLTTIVICIQDCFELERKQHISADWCADILQKLYKSMVCLKFLIQIKEVNTPVRFTPMYY